MAKNTDLGRILLVGAGKMGGALIQSWLEKGTRNPSDIVLVEPRVSRAKYFRDQYNLYTFETPEAINAGLGDAIVLFAIKPQVMEEVVPLYKTLIQPGQLVLSIAAGTPINFFERQLGERVPVVRAMPNTPAAIGHGITVLCANDHVTDMQRADCKVLLDAVGETVWIDDETLMDAVTAISGSGPAYVFLLIEAMTEAGIDIGLPRDLSAQLAVSTVSGAGILAKSADEPPPTLRKNVTSPGGTTAAALDVLTAKGGLKSLLSEAIKAAKKRGEVLAKTG